MLETIPTKAASNPILFTGAGPGAVDLITVRGLNALKQADLVLYAGSLVNPELLQVCSEHCQRIDSAKMHLDEQIACMVKAWQQGLRVVRLHSGDPSLYGAIREQQQGLNAHNIPWAVIPGVTAAMAAAAALGCELTIPEQAQSLVLTRCQGRTPLPPSQTPSAFAKTKATLAFYLSTGHLDALCHELQTEGGLAPTTPCALANKVSWPDERIIQGSLADIAAKAKAAGIHRQALFLVGEALAHTQASSSCLYDQSFAHGYRNHLAQERFTGSIAVLSFSEQGLAKAQEICAGLQEQATLLPKGAQLSAYWDKYDAFVFIGACGIAVRLAAPLLRDKSTDPALVCLDERGSFVISLLAGHLGGANRLARRIARLCAGQAVITTASDNLGLVAFDEAAARLEALVLNPKAILACNKALIAQEVVAFHGPKAIYDAFWHHVAHVIYAQDNDTHEPALWWDTPCPQERSPQQNLHISSLVLGCGCHRGTAPEILLEQATRFVQRHGFSIQAITAIATITARSDEAALQHLAKTWQKPLLAYDAKTLASTPGIMNPSTHVAKYMGTSSVCEAAALQGATRKQRAVLVAPKEAACSTMTFALAATLPLPLAQSVVATSNTPKQGLLTVVGLGSGQAQQLTPEVKAALLEADCLAGYTPYLEYIKDLKRPEQQLISSGMRSEVERCSQALEAARQGQKVCLVCSGDPGILAMAGLVLELKYAQASLHNVPVKILPGITAASLAAASLGAPLQNGCILLSLSDLLVPATEVRQNILAAAQSHLAIALYNPAGKKRRTLLHEAIATFCTQRGAQTPCALVRHAGQAQEETWLGVLADFPFEKVDMSTLVLIGSHRTKIVGKCMYEARGYADKYRYPHEDASDTQGERHG